MKYFSEREEGEQPRQNEEIGEVPWGGVQALVCAMIKDGSFRASYPETCYDGAGLLRELLFLQTSASQTWIE
ncbi:MAG TPA: hypothetical protein ENI55_04090 [Alphaproteobacteria bacterium]|nr:hypothetical protein [Alphaproteobacteria bacterium]